RISCLGKPVASLKRAVSASSGQSWAGVARSRRASVRVRGLRARASPIGGILPGEAGQGGDRLDAVDAGDAAEVGGIDFALAVAADLILVDAAQDEQRIEPGVAGADHVG